MKAGREPEVRIVEQPEYKREVCPFGEDGATNLTIHLAKRPCLWNRIWMRLFFGWKFREIK